MARCLRSFSIASHVGIALLFLSLHSVCASGGLSREETTTTTAADLSNNHGGVASGSTSSSTSTPASRLRAGRQLQARGRQISYPSYAQIGEELRVMSSRYPELVEVFTAQDRYGTPSPITGCRASTSSPTTYEPCKHHVLIITNRTSAMIDTPVFSTHIRDRPQVFFSGNLHGDETVGPVTLYSMAKLLLEGATPSSPHFNPWIARLVNTRKIVIMPITNPQGYDSMTREEDRVDPNRDFPYAEVPSKCMVTATARAVNEVWREHIFQLAVTFHGGMQAISYEWGSPNHEGHGSESPDDKAQEWLAKVMRDAAGTYAGNRYPIGRMNPLVYPVTGGMEDWAYAGSWDKSAVTACTPRTHGGYPAEKMIYNSAQLRAVNVLVETWDVKSPAVSQLGYDDLEQMLVIQGAGDGHAPRNLRLALSVIDLVEPYIEITKNITTASYPGTQHDILPAAPGQGRRGESDDRSLVAGEEDAGKTPHPISPGLCVPFNLTAGAVENAPVDCARYSDAYMQWRSVTVGVNVVGSSASSSSYPGAGQEPQQALQFSEVDADVTLWTGWDVGGALNVDTTSVLIAPWDARVPPQAFYHMKPVVEESSDSTSDSNAPIYDENVLWVLRETYGLSTKESEEFAARLYTLQQFANGRISDTTAITSSPLFRTDFTSSSGSTRWFFNDVVPAGKTPTPPLIPRSTPSPGPEGAAPLPRSPVPGAPDLVYNPYETRFANCMVIRASGLSAQVDGMGMRECSSEGSRLMQEEEGEEKGNGLRSSKGTSAAKHIDAASFRSLADTLLSSGSSDSVPSGSIPPFQAAVRTLIVLPFAKVDADFARQRDPEPVGTPPQTHWVNARINPAWSMTNNEYRVRGRHQWVGKPLFYGVETMVQLVLPGAPSPTPIPALASPGASKSSEPDTIMDTDGDGKSGDSAQISATSAFFAGMGASAAAATLFLFVRAVAARHAERKDAASVAASRRAAPWTIEEDAVPRGGKGVPVREGGGGQQKKREREGQGEAQLPKKQGAGGGAAATASASSSSASASGSGTMDVVDDDDEDHEGVVFDNADIAIGGEEDEEENEEGEERQTGPGAGAGTAAAAAAAASHYNGRGARSTGKSGGTDEGDEAPLTAGGVKVWDGRRV